MARINLLPWREELRKQKQQDFLAGILAGVLFAIFVLLLVYLYIEGLKEYQERRNKIIVDEISILDKKITEIKDIEEKKNRLLTKIDLIQSLQESRPEIVHLFDELPRITPDGLYLTKFVQVGSNLTMDGKAESNARISALMRAIENSQWLNSPILGVIKGQGTGNAELNDFSMIARQGKKTTTNQNGAKQ